MKILVTIVLLSLIGCAPVNNPRSSHTTWFQQQARLVNVTMKDNNHAVLTLLTPKKDTVKVLWASTGMGKPHWIVGTRYTVQCDSSDYKVIEGRRYYLAKLKRNY